MVKCDSSLQRMCFQCSRVQWWWALHPSSQRLALHMVILGLCEAAGPCKPISLSSRRTVIVLSLLPEAVWNSVVSVATENRRFLCTTRFGTQWSCSVSLCGLQLHGWAVVAPRHFHFTITALIVDRGSSSRAEIFRTDLLERWHPMTVPHWKSLSSSVRLFYCQCPCMDGCVLDLIHLSATGVAEIVKSTNFKGCQDTFVYIIYLLDLLMFWGRNVQCHDHVVKRQCYGLTFMIALVSARSFFYDKINATCM